MLTVWAGAGGAPKIVSLTAATADGADASGGLLNNVLLRGFAGVKLDLKKSSPCSEPSLADGNDPRPWCAACSPSPYHLSYRLALISFCC